SCTDTCTYYSSLLVSADTPPTKGVYAERPRPSGRNSESPAHRAGLLFVLGAISSVAGCDRSGSVRLVTPGDRRRCGRRRCRMKTCHTIRHVRRVTAVSLDEETRETPTEA